jgi:hypothetical protein
MFGFQEIFPPKPTIEDLGMEARRQAYSATTGLFLKKGIMPEMSDMNGMPNIFGFPDISSSRMISNALSKQGPILKLFDVDGVILPFSEDEYDRSIGRIFKSKSLKSIFMGSGVKEIADIPQKEGEQVGMAFSRSFGFWPRQKVLRAELNNVSMPLIDRFDRHHPPTETSEKPKVWDVFENTLIELVKPLNLNGNTLNINHHGDILPPISLLGGNEGIIINWLSKFFTTLGIKTNPNITYINPVFPSEGMQLDSQTFQFQPINFQS